MPRYTYRCEDCGAVISERHSATKKVENCKECGSIGSLVRIPSTIRVVKEHQADKKNPGALVKDSIEEFKQDLASEKEKLKNNMWEPN